MSMTAEQMAAYLIVKNEDGTEFDLSYDAKAELIEELEIGVNVAADEPQRSTIILDYDPNRDPR